MNTDPLPPERPPFAEDDDCVDGWKPHYTDGRPCWCIPTIEPYMDCDLIIHNEGN